MTDDNDRSPDAARGFGGLGSISNDVAPRAGEEGTAPSAEGKPSARLLADESRHTGTANAEPREALQPDLRQRSSYSRRFGWFVLGASALFVSSIVWQATAGKSETAKARVHYTSAPTPAPKPSLTLTASFEEKPPAGTGLSFSIAQIRYCIGEKTRLQAIQTHIQSLTGSRAFNDLVPQFNSLVSDYNSRCTSFRYLPGDLEKAQIDIAGETIRLQREAADRITKWQADLATRSPAQLGQSADQDGGVGSPNDASQSVLENQETSENRTRATPFGGETAQSAASAESPGWDRDQNLRDAATEFLTTYKRQGMSGSVALIDDCYEHAKNLPPKSDQKLKTLEYCAGMDYMAYSIDKAGVKQYGFPPSEFFIGNKVQTRLDRVSEWFATADDKDRFIEGLVQRADEQLANAVRDTTSRKNR